jgi:hypothetical protein
MDVLAGFAVISMLAVFAASEGRVLINRQPNAALDVPPNVRYWG